MNPEARALSALTVETIAARRPQSVPVFERHGIDFGRAGGKRLIEACNRRGLRVETLVHEIEFEERLRQWQAASSETWRARPVEDIIDHIVIAYHEQLRAELPRLEHLLRKVTHVHQDRHPELAPVLETFLDLCDELEPHMIKEENVVFPRILDGLPVSSPLRVMQHEHERAREKLSRLRTLTAHYQPPPDACDSYRALCRGLSELETVLLEHIHLEDDVLFPRVLESTT